MFEKNVIIFDEKESILISGLGKYSLTDTMECGQCFRYEKIKRTDGYDEYMTITGNTLMRVVQRERGELIFVGMSNETFEAVARGYFAIDTNLDEVRADIINNTDSQWLKSAADFASGIAILKQDAWESLISFIISQNNNIPRIRKIVREISGQYGTNLILQNDNKSCPIGAINTKPNHADCSKCGKCYTFPTAIDIMNNPENLLPSKPGFRYGYILDAAEKIATGKINLTEIERKNNFDYTLETLKQIKGVGDKVASCVALFGCANLEAFPIDVWMKRAIDTYFDGKLDPKTLGKYAGIAQQYIFHYIRNIEKN